MRRERILLGVVVLIGTSLAMLAGCSDVTSPEYQRNSQKSTDSGTGGANDGNDAAFTVQSGLGPVRVFDATPDLSAGAVLFRLAYNPPQGETVQRLFTLQLNCDSANHPYLASTLKDTSGNALWNFRFTVLNVQRRQERIEITTPVRSIVFERDEQDSVVNETYIVDGERHVYSLSTTDQARLVDICRHARDSGRIDLSRVADLRPFNKNVMSILDDFQDFYSRRGSFDAGPDNDVGFQLLQTEGIRQRFASEMPSSAVRSGDITWQDICDFATSCAMVACEFGPNPICNACASVVTVCVIVKIWHWITSIFS